jgi:hypothetical protein
MAGQLFSESTGTKVSDAAAGFSPKSAPLRDRFPHEELGTLLGMVLEERTWAQECP